MDTKDKPKIDPPATPTEQTNTSSASQGPDSKPDDLDALQKAENWDLFVDRKIMSRAMAKVLMDKHWTPAVLRLGKVTQRDLLEIPYFGQARLRCLLSIFPTIPLGQRRRRSHLAAHASDNPGRASPANPESDPGSPLTCPHCGGGLRLEAAKAREPESPAPIPEPDHPQFHFDVYAYLEVLPVVVAELAAKEGQDFEETRQAWVRKVKAWRRLKLGEEDRDTIAGEENAGAPERVVSGWVSEVEGRLRNAQGAAYEEWFERMLLEGYRHEGVREARIVKIVRGGGQSHAPDLEVHYEDNHVDYWSLKTWSIRPYMTIAVRNGGAQKPSDVKPELDAFLAACEKRKAAVAAGATTLPPTARLCIGVREVLTPKAEYLRIIETPAGIAPTISFSRREIDAPSAIVWKKPETSPTNQNAHPSFTSGVQSDAMEQGGFDRTGDDAGAIS